MMNQFMVEITLPSELTEEFLSLIPKQRALVHKLFAEGRLTSYALSMDRSKLWAAIVAESEEEVTQILSLLPLRKFMQIEIHQLAFHQDAAMNVARISMN
jgi:muconolactone delta-isomerase